MSNHNSAPSAFMTMLEIFIPQTLKWQPNPPKWSKINLMILFECVYSRCIINGLIQLKIIVSSLRQSNSAFVFKNCPSALSIQIKYHMKGKTEKGRKKASRGAWKKSLRHSRCSWPWNVHNWTKESDARGLRNRI